MGMLKALSSSVAIVIFGLGAFLFANGWQNTSQITDRGLTTNFAGQACYSSICLRPEWIGLGSGSILAGIVLLVVGLRVDPNAPTQRSEPLRAWLAAVGGAGLRLLAFWPSWLRLRTLLWVVIALSVSAKLASAMFH